MFFFLKQSKILLRYLKYFKKEKKYFKTDNKKVWFLNASKLLTHCRPAMPFGNIKTYFRGSFQFTIVTIQKISTPGKHEI